MRNWWSVGVQLLYRTERLWFFLCSPPLSSFQSTMSPEKSYQPVFAAQEEEVRAGDRGSVNQIPFLLLKR